jgi:hypothetical protein
MSARVVRVNQVEAARLQHETKRTQGFAGQYLPRCCGVERRTFARQQERIVSGGEQSLMQPQDLPLSAAHLATAIEVQDLHFCNSRALAYFAKV